MSKEFGIRAENRATKKREIVCQSMSFDEAKNWKPYNYQKRSHKYFRVVKVANYK